MRRKAKKRLKLEMQENGLWDEFVRRREALKREGVLPGKRWIQAAIAVGVIDEDSSHLDDPYVRDEGMPEPIGDELPISLLRLYGWDKNTFPQKQSTQTPRQA